MNNGNQNQWTKVSDVSNNERFEPHKNENNQSYPRSIEGYFIKTREIAGMDNKYFKSHEIVMVMPDGSHKHFDITGGVSLDKKLEATPLNTYVRIDYLGRVQSKHSGRQPFKNWEVYAAAGAVTYDKIPKPASQAQAPQANIPAPTAPPTNPFPTQQQGSFTPPPVQQNNPFPPQGTPPPVQGNGAFPTFPAGQGNPFPKDPPF